MTRSSTAVQDVVLVLSQESVGDIVLRGFHRPPDRALLTLAGDDRVGRLLVTSSFRSYPVQWAKRLMGRTDPPLEIDGDVRQLQPRRLRRSDPRTVAGCERTFQRFDEVVHRACVDEGMESPAIVTFHPLVAGFAPFRWARSVTYYARDDWAALPAYAPWRDVCLEAYVRLRAMDRRVVAVSQPLLDRLGPIDRGLLLPNAVEPTEWNVPLEVPAWLDPLPHPRFLYAGTLDDRLDLAAFEQMADGFPSGSVVLMGPLMPDSPVASLKRPNIHLVPSKPRGELAAAVRSVDACVLLHRETPLTRAMSPLKLYEYLAGGRPVVATDLPPVHGIDERVVCVAPGGDVVSAAASALALGPLSEAERLQFIDDNSWARRHEAFLDLVLS
jgi:hypothetical protein